MKYFIIAKETIPEDLGDEPKTTIFAGSVMTEEVFIDQSTKQWPELQGKSANEMIVDINMNSKFLVLMIPDS